MPVGEKSIHSDRFPYFREHLIAARKRAGMTQVEFAEAAETTQQYVSFVENGDVRLDFLQLMNWLQVSNTDIVEFAASVKKSIEEAAEQKLAETGGDAPAP